MSTPLLSVRNLTLRFGGLTAVDAASFTIKPGEIVGLIGPNGAGKTSLFNAITGIYRPTEGTVMFGGRMIVGLKRHQIAKLGIARTFQNIRLFNSMTALENVMVGTDAHARSGLFRALARTRTQRREEEASRRRALELLDFVGLVDRADELAGSLPYGDQRRLEIARAMATQPRLLCLDEPAAGFNPAEKVELMQLIRRLRDQGYTVLVIEHDMKLVMGVTDRIVVLEFGRKIAEGTPAEIRDNPAVIAAYLGVDEEDAS